MAIEARNVLASDNLPSLSWIALKVLKLVRSAEPDVKGIVRTIKGDPALAAKILRTVNSSAFGLNRKVTSIDQAVAYIGFLTLCSLVLTFSLIPSERKRGPLADRLRSFWRSALTQAVAAEELARRAAHPMPAEFFSAGLLQDIGVLALIRTSPDEYLPVLDAADGSEEQLSAIEQARLGLDHQHIGSELTRRWGLVEHVPAAIAAHHSDPAEAPSDSAEGALLRSGLAAAAAAADALCRQPRRAGFSRFQRIAGQHFRIPEDGAAEFLRAVDARVRETAEMFSFDLGGGPSFDEIIAEAQSELVQVTLRAQRENDQVVARASELESQKEEMTRAAADLRLLARHDPLTGLPNRNALQEELERSWEAARKSGDSVGVIFIDVDHFKRLNDTYGHLVGDEALKAIARLLRARIGPRGMPGRFGGEELVVLLARATAAEIQRLAEELRADIEAHELHDGSRVIRMTASFGAAIVRPADATPDGFLELIAAADGAMFQAKQNGRNQVRYVSLGRQLTPDPQPAAPTHQARRDPLTGLPNRNLFQTVLEKQWRRSALAREPVGVAFVDLDRFGEVNRVHGQLAGDALLRMVAETLSQLVGTSGFAARYGGEEFVAVLPGSSEGRLRHFAEELQRRIGGSATSGERPSIELTVSIGIAFAEPARCHENGFLDVLAAADGAMGAAKRAGRNQSCLVRFGG